MKSHEVLRRHAVLSTPVKKKHLLTLVRKTCCTDEDNKE